jgi:elongation factor Ts
MEITAALVKELRERTGAGMMECKKALVNAEGNIEAAIEAMRKAGQAKADKKSGRIAAEGLIVIQTQNNKAAMLEINSETDFVSKSDDFKDFCQQAVAKVLEYQPKDVENLLASEYANGKTIEEARRDLVTKIGENIAVRRFAVAEGEQLGVYLHGSRIGVIVELQGGDAELAKDIAMHIAASRPQCVAASEVSAELIAKERDILRARAQDSGKPAEIVEKMLDGQVKKFLEGITLLGQPFVKDPSMSVEKLLGSKKAQVKSFQRFEVGEGIEKKSENFAAEVMKQAQGTA